MFYKISSDKFLVFAEADFGEIYKVPLEVPETPCYCFLVIGNQELASSYCKRRFVFKVQFDLY